MPGEDEGPDTDRDQMGEIKEEDDGEESMMDDTQSQYTQSTAPMMNSSQYTKYMRSLIKLLIGEKVLHEWVKEGTVD